jgi:hypothetical protein
VNTGMNMCLIRAGNCLTSCKLREEGLMLDNTKLFKVNSVDT